MIKRAALTRIDLLMLLVILCWGLNLTLIKLSLREIPPLPFNAIRLPLAAAVLLAMLLGRGRSPRAQRVEGRHWPRLLLLSISGQTLYQYLFIVGFNLTTASNTAVILATSPLFISLLSTGFKHERIRPLGWIGILLAFAGVYLVLAGKSGGFRFSWSSLKGDLILLVAVALWAHYSVSSRPLLRTYSPLQLSAVTMGIGALLFIPLGLPGLASVHPAKVSLTAWACLAYSGIFALAVALVIWFTSIQKVGNSQTAVFSNLQPVVAVLFAHWILKEQVHASLLAGALLIFVGIFFTRRGHAPAHAEDC